VPNLYIVELAASHPFYNALNCRNALFMDSPTCADARRTLANVHFVAQVGNKRLRVEGWAGG